MLNWLTRYAFVAAELGFDESGQLTESVLDVGCGPHGLACALGDVTFAGVDVEFPNPVAPGMVAFRSVPGELPFADASFETVVCLDVLEHVPAQERRSFVTELARVASRRVLLACPSDEAAWIDNWLRGIYRSNGVAAPSWLDEHGEHGLPTVAEIREVCTSVPGFTGSELQMTNGLLAAVVVFGDMLPESSGLAGDEYSKHAAEWLELFKAARFGESYRRGFTIERDLVRQPKVIASNLRDTVWHAVRCPSCGADALRSRAEGAVCRNCQHAIGLDRSGAFDLTRSAPPTLAPVNSSKRVRVVVKPDWRRPETWLPIVATYLAVSIPGGDYALCLDAVDSELAFTIIQQMVAGACAALAGDRPFGDIILLDTPYVNESLIEVTTVDEMTGRLGLRRVERPQTPEAIARHAVAAKVLSDSLRAISERHLYQVAGDPWTTREPLVTVRIATWKGHKLLLERTIPSVLNGNYRNIEVIVCSDGPDAEAKAAVGSVGDPRVRYLELPERPVYAQQPWSFWQTAGIYAMNEAVKQANGSFIAPLDHDDVFTVDHIDSMLGVAASQQADFVFGQALVEEASGAWRTLGSEPLRHANITHGAAMFSSRLAHVQLDPDCWLRNDPGDWNMFRRMAETGTRVGFVPSLVMAHFKERSSIAVDGDHSATMRWADRQLSEIVADIYRTGVEWLLDVPLPSLG